MKLNIYKDKKVEKTYTASTYDLMFGTVEDILNIVKAEDMKASTNQELLKVVSNLALRSMGTVKGLLMDIFPGLTEDELRNAKIKEIATVLIEVVRYAIVQMGGTEKN